MKTEATVDDLYRVEGKAELVHGELVQMNPTGYLPGRAGGNIHFSLRQSEKQNPGVGRAVPENVGFSVDLPHRKSFSPDVAFHTGTPTGMKFLNGSPALSVETRSENDDGPAAEHAIAAKTTDYFAAVAPVVWDVVIAPHRLPRRTIDAVNWPTPSRPYRDGKCLWKKYSTTNRFRQL